MILIEDIEDKMRSRHSMYMYYDVYVCTYDTSYMYGPMDAHCVQGDHCPFSSVHCQGSAFQ